jgi:hypothetical protein
MTSQLPRTWQRAFSNRSSAWLRKLSVFAPLAAAYASFQAVLSSLPPSLSYDDIHYLLAVVSGLAAGGIVGCAMLLTRKTRPQSGAAALLPAPEQQLDKRTPSAQGIDIPGTSRMCFQTLLDTLVSFDDPVLGRLTGWPHFLHEARAGDRPTAFGTAYGLKLTLALGSQDGRLDRASLADTLWKLRRSDGGWASRTQGDVGRPEVTGIILGALAAAGSDYARLTEAAAVFESMLAPRTDPTAISSTFVVASVIRELVRIRPSSPRIAELRAILLDGTIQAPTRDNLVCWSARLDKGRSQAPSPAHTALAVVALARARQVCGDDNQSRLAVAQAVRWLTLSRNLENQTEQIRRVVTPDRREPLTVNLFTAAWIARALMAADASDGTEAGSLLDEAIKKIIGMQRNGIWEWADGSQPIWMSYQGISTLQAFALSHWTAP